MFIALGMVARSPAHGAPVVASTATVVWLLAAGLVVVGLALVLVGVRLIRATRADHAALGPLEVIGDRSFRRADGDRQATVISHARPPGAEPASAAIAVLDPSVGVNGASPSFPLHQQASPAVDGGGSELPQAGIDRVVNDPEIDDRDPADRLSGAVLVADAPDPLTAPVPVPQPGPDPIPNPYPPPGPDPMPEPGPYPPPGPDPMPEPGPYPSPAPDPMPEPVPPSPPEPGPDPGPLPDPSPGPIPAVPEIEPSPGAPEIELSPDATADDAGVSASSGGHGRPDTVADSVGDD